MRYNDPSPLEVRVISQRFDIPNSVSIDTYLANDGYVAIKKVLGLTPEAIIEELKTSALRGRGGAGFPTGMKWSFVPRNTGKPTYIICNSDESEPGTCKDRLLMENDPHQLIEGMLIAGWTIKSNKGYIFIRGEYRYLIDIVDRAIAEAYERGYLGKNILGSGWDFDVYTHTGAGAYECGEESALLESLEGKRGVPRLKPPFPAVVGAFQSPTILNNCETFSAVPVIFRNGGAWYSSLGTPKNGGTRLVCISGHVNKPGVYELPMGFPIMRIIDEVCGGVRNGKKLKAVIPGGSSAPVLRAEECDIPYDFDSLAKAKSMAGSGGIVVLDEDTDIVAVALRTIKFYAHESCGWCIPCREGTTWLKKLLTRFHEGGGVPSDIDLIGELSANMLGRTFCALGDAAAMPTGGFITKFRGEFEEYLRKSRATTPVAELASV
ncbi:MAG: NADH-quinone oxidoreductase subunit NuoF [Acidobacteriaceae bacterium]|nr:NADH-quinone oxidoreductase subunit NuoF [Acidobacteriaceae bacterium]MBV9500417.1 NADH-quinone oxidoreductase subunit NuoF [Acidobacteriaceae bacterium]